MHRSYSADMVCHWEDSDTVAQEVYINVRRTSLEALLMRSPMLTKPHFSGLADCDMYRVRRTNCMKALDPLSYRGLCTLCARIIPEAQPTMYNGYTRSNHSSSSLCMMWDATVNQDSVIKFPGRMKQVTHLCVNCFLFAVVVRLSY
jgi:hypothetical protein